MSAYNNELAGEGMRSCVQDESEKKEIEVGGCYVTLPYTVCSLLN